MIKKSLQRVMDTRFWGPSGWRLLHLIAAVPVAKTRRAAVKEWFELLEFILPCKYCRASFHDYMKLQPLTNHIMSRPERFGRWLYDIHNRVNAKLRDQGLLLLQDPKWPAVRAQYKAMQAGLCEESPLLGWDFMTSVAFSTPGSRKPVPMNDVPSRELSLKERNRYNLLSREERIRALTRWWNLIPSILPCEAWRSAWAAASAGHHVPLLKGHQAVMRWMWRIEESVCGDLKCPTPHPSLPEMEKEVSAFESDCGKKKTGKTCRTRKHRQRQRVLTRRGRR